MKHDLMKKRIVCCFAGFLMCMSIIFAKSVSAYAAEATKDSITTLKAGFLPESYYEESLSATKYREVNGIVYELSNDKDTNEAVVYGFDTGGEDSYPYGQWETETTVNIDDLTLVIPATITVGDNIYTVSGINANAFSGQSTLKQVKISEGIISIGDNAFNRCGALESVKIPASVEQIGERVFSNCNALISAEYAEGTKLKTTGEYIFDECISLDSVKLSEGIETIGTAAFRGTSSLEIVDLPDSLKEIGEIAFASVDVVNSYLTEDRHNHSALTSITLPEGLTTIGVGALSDCEKLSEIIVEEDNTKFSVGDDGFLYETAGDLKKLIVYPHAKKLKTITIPADVTLETSVFSTDQILETVIFEGEGMTVPQSAFSSCSALTSVIFNGSVASIDWYAFSSCSKLETVTFEKTITRIEEGAFSNCISLKQITLPAGIEYVASNSGAGQSSVTSAFEGCTSLETVNVSKYAHIGMNDGVFGSSSDNGIKNKMFNGCTSIKSFVVIDDAESIGYTPVEQRDYYKSIDDVLFVEVAYDCDNNNEYETKLLKLMAYPQGSENVNYEVPANVNRINSFAFSNTQNLKNITFADVSEEESATFPLDSMIEKSAFANSSIESLTTNTRLWTINEYAFSNCNALKNVTITDNASTIEGYAFYNCNALETVNIPDTVTSIGSRCFMECTSLKNVNFPENKSFKVVQKDIFWNCDAMESITIPENVTCIMDEAIYSARNIKKVIIENSDMELKNEEAALPDDVPYVHESAFNGVANDCSFFVKSNSKTERTIKTIIDRFLLFG